METIIYCLFLFFIGASWGTAVLYAGKGANSRSSNAVFPARPLVNSALYGCRVLFLWLGFASYAYGLCQVLQVDCTFSQCLFFVTASALPRYAIWIATPLRNISYGAYRLYKAALITSSLLFILFLFLSFKTNFYLSSFKAFEITIGIDILIVTITCSEVKFVPESLSAFMRWQRYQNGTITIWYPQTLPSGIPEALGVEAAKIVKAATHLIAVKVCHSNIDIFVFSDQKQHDIANNAHGLQIKGTSSKNGCTVLFTNWEDTTEVLTHEVCHVVLYQSISAYLPIMIDEGLTLCITFEILQKYAHKPQFCLIMNSLQEMIIDQEFRKWQFSDEPAVTRHAYYLYAESFVEFVLNQYGIQNLKQLCKDLYLNKMLLSPQEIDQVCYRVFGISVIELETRWRNSRLPGMYL